MSTAHGSRPRAASCYPSRDPATDEVIAEVVAGTAGDVDRAVAPARRAFESWAATAATERAAYLSAIAETLVAREPFGVSA